MSFFRTQGLLAAGLGLLAIGCDEPEFRTDLAPEGEPVLLSVNALSAVIETPRLLENFGIDSFYEEATYCSDAEGARVSDIYCFDKQGNRMTSGTDYGNGPWIAPMPDTVATGWYVRPVFDELLDPDSVEEIVDGNGTITAKNPVTIECEINGTMTEIAYDGWYDPSGNRDSDPPGPSLFVTPSAGFAAPTNGRCQISLNDTIHDKDGLAPPADSLTAHEFYIEPLAFAGSAPAACEDGFVPRTCACVPSGGACTEDKNGDDICAMPDDVLEYTTIAVQIFFNASLDPASLDGHFSFADADDNAVAFTLALDPEDPSVVVVTPDTALAIDTVYTISVTSMGDGRIGDALGGGNDLEQIVFTFSTTEVAAGDPSVACPE